MIKQWVARVGSVGAACLAASVLLAGCQSAPSLRDPTGDPVAQTSSPPAYLAKYVDVVEIGGALSSQAAEFRVKVAATSAPPKPVRASFDVDTSGDGFPDYFVDLRRQSGTVTYSVVGFRGVTYCEGNARFDGSSVYSAAVPASCIGSPDRVASSVRSYIYDSSRTYWMDETGQLVVQRT